MTEPRRVMINWEYLCHGIEWVPTKEEHETPYPEGLQLEKVQRPGKPPIPRPWRERLSEQLISDLKAWNDSWGPQGAPDLEARPGAARAGEGACGPGAGRAGDR